MSRRGGRGVALVASLSIMIVLAAASAWAVRPADHGPARLELPSIQGEWRVDRQASADEVAPNSGVFKPLGAPGQVMLPYGDGINRVGPADQHDTPCPDGEPCGP